LNTVGRVVAAGGVAKKRINTGSRIQVAGRVAKKRITTVGRVLKASGVAKERIFAQPKVQPRFFAVSALVTAQDDSYTRLTR
jgi:Ni,Fe-hydrogenase III large subunit